MTLFQLLICIIVYIIIWLLKKHINEHCADHYPEIDSCCITQNSRPNDGISTLQNAFILE